MKKPIILSVLFFIITSISSFGQGGGDPAFNFLAEEIGKNRALLDSLSQTLQPIVKPEFFLSYLENGERFGITPEQAAAITANTTKIDALISDVTTQFETLGNNDTAIGEQLTTLGQNDISIGEQMTTLGENDQSISEQMATLSENDETIMAEINAMKAQLQNLVAAVAQKDAEIAEKDAEIAELKQGGGGQTLEQVLEQVQDARLGSVVLNPDAEGNMTLKLEIEESYDLTVWENNGESVEVELPLTEGKKFLRFALK